MLFTATYRLRQKPGEDGVLLVEAEAQDAQEGLISQSFDLPLQQAIGKNDAENSLRAMLRNLLGGEDRSDGIDEAVNLLRKNIDHNGTLYKYHSGLRISDDAPRLTALVRLHLQFLARSAVGRRAFSETTPDAFIAGLADSDSKLVTFAFDPEMSMRNRRSGEGGRMDLFLDGSNAVTMILVANQDVEKSVQDINAEREDLKLLLDMIVRQKVQDKQREDGILRKRLQTIEAMLEGTFHRISPLSIKEAEKQQVRSQWESARRLMSADDGAQETVTVSTVTDVLAPIAPPMALSSTGDAQADLTETLNAYAAQLVGSFRQAEPTRRFRDVRVEVRFDYNPQAVLSLPKFSIRECFDVLLKNAVEATTPLAEEYPAVIHVSVEIRPGADGQSVLDIKIDNPHAEMLASVWAALTATTPTRTGANERKREVTGHSTGVGVFAARQLLQMGYGSGADIRYEPLGPNRLRARMSLPCSMLAPAVATPTVAEPDGDVSVVTARGPYILYVEDDSDLLERGLDALRVACDPVPVLGAAERSTAAKFIEAGLPEVMLTDMQIPMAPGQRARPAEGVATVWAYVSACVAAGRDPICLVVSGDSADRIVERLDAHRGSGNDVPIRVVEPPWADMTVEPGITILSGLKDLSLGEGAADRIAAALATREVGVVDVTREAAPQTPVAAASSPVRRLASASLDGALEGADLADTSTTLMIELEDQDPVEPVVAWMSHPGLEDMDLRDGVLTALSNADYNGHIVLTVAVPEALDSLALRFWLSRHKVLPRAAADTLDGDTWRAFPNESGGILSRLRHDIRNIRVDGLSPKLFAAFEETTTALETLLAFDPGQPFHEALAAGETEAAEAALRQAMTAAAERQTPKRRSEVVAELRRTSLKLDTLAEAVAGQDRRPLSSVTSLQAALATFEIILLAQPQSEDAA